MWFSLIRLEISLYLFSFSFPIFREGVQISLMVSQKIILNNLLSQMDPMTLPCPFFQISECQDWSFRPSPLLFINCRTLFKTSVRVPQILLFDVANARPIIRPTRVADPPHTLFYLNVAPTSRMSKRARSFVQSATYNGEPKSSHSPHTLVPNSSSIIKCVLFIFYIILFYLFKNK